MSAPANRPIFVVGTPRSGTTLLRYMLCAHPCIYIPPESNCIPRFFRRRPATVFHPQQPSVSCSKSRRTLL